jgi:bacterioferritin
VKAAGVFVSDIKDIRRRARKDLDAGAVTKNYSGDVKEAIRLLNHAVATEYATSFTP